MISKEELLIEMSEMLLFNDQKRMEIDGRWITVCRGQVTAKRGSPLVIILAGKRKVRSRQVKGDLQHLSFTHYIKVNDPRYLDTMMYANFEKLYKTSIEPNRFMYIHIKFKLGKQRKCKAKKKK